jgi:hypothetical protein
VSLAGSPPASAQATGDKKKALELFDQANKKFNLGEFKAAIDLFTQAYETYDAPEFLFNIAQAYRFDGNCPKAVFFYRRYLAQKPNAPNKDEVDGYVKDLETKCPEGSGGGTAAGTGTGTAGTGTGTAGTGTGTPGTGTGTTGTTTGTGTATGTGTPTTGTTGTPTTGGTGTATGTGMPATGTTGPTRVAAAGGTETGVEGQGGGLIGPQQQRKLDATFDLGPSFASMGDLQTPVLFSVAIGAGYPLQLGSMEVAPGLLLAYTPVPWEGDNTDMSGTAGLWAILANVGASRPVAPKISVRGDLGLGLQVLSGVTKAGNPFLNPDQVASGPLSMFNVRVALGAEYELTPNVSVNAQPLVLSWSPTSKLRDDISSITRYEFLIGAGYKL